MYRTEQLSPRRSPFVVAGALGLATHECWPAESFSSLSSISRSFCSVVSVE